MTISVKELVRLERDARRAVRRGDMAALDRINEKLAESNFKLIVRDGKLWIANRQLVERGDHGPTT